MISYQVESVKDCIEELKGMIYDHASEIDLYQEKFSLDPDFGQYIRSDEIGLTFLVTAREDGEMIGYTLFFVMYHPHYKTIKYANNDMLYVSPSKRRSGVFPEMMKFAEEKLKEAGVEVVCFQMKTDFAFESLAEELGYNRAEIMYSKYIKE